MAAHWRPDPAAGVFETLLVLDGRPVELDAHLSRLEASLAELFPGWPIPALGAVTAPEPDCVMRIDVVPRSDRFETEISFREIRRQPESAALHSLSVPGGLGAHKWADRVLLDKAQAKLPGGALPLLVDGDEVLEASRASVFAVHRGALLTPPLDGRILPGVTRMRVLRIAEALGVEVHEEPLSRGDLLTADEVFLTGSLRGVEPAVALDGERLAAGGEIAGRLAAGLRRAWAGLGTAASFGDRLAQPHAVAGLRTRQDGKVTQ